MPTRKALLALSFSCSIACLPRAASAQLEPPETQPGLPAIRADSTGTAVREDRDTGSVRFTLEDALHALRAEHPALIAAEHAVSAARADRRATSLWQNPVISGQYYKGVRHNTYDEIGYPTYGISQFLELANAPAARGRAANLTVWATRGDYGSMLISLSLDVQAAMIDLVSAQRKVALVQQALALLDHAAKIVDQRVA
ncbi:MAG: TolC family protein, partial [Myxococcaceae bacterium]|nr:TolC family protein [Myxococcaceae bacterium]